MKACPQCGTGIPAGSHWQRKFCSDACRTAFWIKENRERWLKTLHRNHRQARGKHYAQSLAREAVDRALRRGKMTKPDTCSRCGASGVIEGHHSDYSKVLEVVWLCSPCHREEHGKAR